MDNVIGIEIDPKGSADMFDTDTDSDTEKHFRSDQGLN
jgi:hypothetical protein